MKLAFADTYKWVADEKYMTEVTVKDLLSDGYLSERAKLINMDQATRASHGTPPKGGTIYLTCLLYTSPSPRDRQKSRMPSSA